MTKTPTDALRLVPARLTEEMINSYYDACGRYGFHAHINATAAWTSFLKAAPASPLPGGGPTCQLCASKIEGWICQGCGSHFYENDAGALVLSTIPAAPTGDA